MFKDKKIPLELLVDLQMPLLSQLPSNQEFLSTRLEQVDQKAFSLARKEFHLGWGFLHNPSERGRAEKVA